MKKPILQRRRHWFGYRPRRALMMGRCFDVLVLQQRGEFVLAQIKGSLRAFQVFEGRADYVLEFVWDGGSQSLRHYFRKPLSARLTEMARLGMALARVWKIRQLRRRKK